MPLEVPQRNDWDPQPIRISDLFTLRKGDKHAVCELWRHAFGWELRLEAAGEMLQTQVCRSQKEWVDLFEQWKRDDREGLATKAVRMPCRI
jgi:hypothetical protein